MAHRTMIANRTGRYGTRMLTADEPVVMSGPEARLALALKAVREGDEQPAKRADKKPAAPKKNKRRKKAKA